MQIEDLKYKPEKIEDIQIQNIYGYLEFLKNSSREKDKARIVLVEKYINTLNGILFRRWSNKILKDYMLKGYAVNQQRLEYLEKTIKLIDIANRMEERLEGGDAKEILNVFLDKQGRGKKQFFLQYPILIKLKIL